MGFDGSRGGVWERLGAASGTVAVVLTAVGAALGDPYRSGLDPDPTDPSPVIARAVAEVRDSARIGVLLGLVGAFLFIWFVAYLRHHLARYEGSDGWMSSAVYGGGLISVALLLVSHSITLAATEIIDYSEDSVVAKVFLTYGWNYFYVVSPAVMALVAAASLISLRFGGLPRWLAVVGLVTVVVPFIAGAGLGAMLGFLWTLLASAALTLTRPTSASRLTS